MKSRFKCKEPARARHGAVQASLQPLRAIRTQLRQAGAHQAARAIARALKSVEGAERHGARRIREEARETEVHAP